MSEPLTLSNVEIAAMAICRAIREDGDPGCTCQEGRVRCVAVETFGDLAEAAVADLDARHRLVVSGAIHRIPIDLVVDT